MEDLHNLEADHQYDMMVEERDAWKGQFSGDVDMFIHFLKEDPVMILENDLIESRFKEYNNIEDYDDSDIKRFIDIQEDDIYAILMRDKECVDAYDEYLNDEFEGK